MGGKLRKNLLIALIFRLETNPGRPAVRNQIAPGSICLYDASPRGRSFSTLLGALSPVAAPPSPVMVMLFDPALAIPSSCLPMSPVKILSLLIFGEYFGNIYDVLIALVFGFSSLSVLGLASSRVEPRRRLNFGEVLAVTVVVVSVGLWGWEMLQLFHIFPIKLPLTYR